jgi:hypothetical protein
VIQVGVLWMSLQSPLLERIVSSYHVNGFPVNVTFTDVDAVLNAVKATVRLCR